MAVSIPDTTVTGALSAAKRRKAAVDRALNVIHSMRDTLPTEAIEHVADALERSAQHLAARDEAPLLDMDATARYFALRHQLLRDALTASQVARLLGTSRQTPHDRARSGALLAIMDRGALRFPPWQFDANGPDGVVAGLPDVLRALQVPVLSQAVWLVRKNPYLDDLAPVEALRRGEQARVLAAARAVGVN